MTTRQRWWLFAFVSMWAGLLDLIFDLRVIGGALSLVAFGLAMYAFDTAKPTTRIRTRAELDDLIEKHLPPETDG